MNNLTINKYLSTFKKKKLKKNTNLFWNSTINCRTFDTPLCLYCVLIVCFESQEFRFEDFRWRSNFSTRGIVLKCGIGCGINILSSAIAHL